MTGIPVKEGAAGASTGWPGWIHIPLLLLLALVLVGLNVAAYRPLSPIDEFQHFDSLVQATHLRVVRVNDQVGQEALQAAACRGIEESPTPPCRSGAYSANDFPGQGYNTADQNSPVYYFLTAAASAPLVLAHLSLLDAGRLTGAIWLWLGLLALWALAAELGASRWARGGVCVMVASCLNVLVPSSTVNPDAATLLVGAGIPLLALRAEARGTAGWPALLAAFAGATLKVHNVLAAGAASLYLCLRLSAGGEDRRRKLLLALGCTAAAIAGQGGWLLIRHFLAPASLVVPPVLQHEYVANFSLSSVASELTNFITPAQAPYLPGFMRHAGLALMTNFQNIALIAGSVGGVLLLKSGTRAHCAAIAVTVSALVGAPLIIIATFLFRHSFVPAFPRYGLSLLPLMAALLAANVRNRPALWSVWAVGLVSSAVVIVDCITAIVRS